MTLVTGNSVLTQALTDITKHDGGPSGPSGTGAGNFGSSTLCSSVDLADPMSFIMGAISKLYAFLHHDAEQTDLSCRQLAQNEMKAKAGKLDDEASTESSHAWAQLGCTVAASAVSIISAASSFADSSDAAVDTKNAADETQAADAMKQAANDPGALDAMNKNLGPDDQLTPSDALQNASADTQQAAADTKAASLSSATAKRTDQFGTAISGALNGIGSFAGTLGKSESDKDAAQVVWYDANTEQFKAQQEAAKSFRTTLDQNYQKLMEASHNAQLAEVDAMKAITRA